MNTSTLPPTISPRAGLLLTQLTKTADFDTALWQLLHDYLEIKIQALAIESAQFEQKWGMAFPAFKQKLADNELSEDAYSYAVEQEFWQWEKVETLRSYYEELRTP